MFGIGAPIIGPLAVSGALPKVIGTAHVSPEHGRTRREGVSKGRARELREESQTNTYRVIHIFFTGRRIVLLHGFQKKSRRTPRGESDIARSRVQQFIDQDRK